MKKVLALVLTTVMMMTMLTACGGSETAAPATEATAEAEGAVSEALADGVLTVCTNAEFPPLNM